MTTTQAPPTPIDEVPDTAGRRPRRRLGRVLLAALAVLVVAEVGVRLVEDRLPPPPDWYTPEYGVKERQLRDLAAEGRSEEHTSELQSLMRISYAVFCLKKKK